MYKARVAAGGADSTCRAVCWLMIDSMSVRRVACRNVSSRLSEKRVSVMWARSAARLAPAPPIRCGTAAACSRSRSCTTHPPLPTSPQLYDYEAPDTVAEPAWVRISIESFKSVTPRILRAPCSQSGWWASNGNRKSCTCNLHLSFYSQLLPSERCCNGGQTQEDDCATPVLPHVRQPQ